MGSEAKIIELASGKSGHLKLLGPLYDVPTACNGRTMVASPQRSGPNSESPHATKSSWRRCAGSTGRLMSRTRTRSFSALRTFPTSDHAVSFYQIKTAAPNPPARRSRIQCVNFVFPAASISTASSKTCFKLDGWINARASGCVAQSMSNTTSLQYS